MVENQTQSIDLTGQQDKNVDRVESWTLTRRYGRTGQIDLIKKKTARQSIELKYQFV